MSSGLLAGGRPRRHQNPVCPFRRQPASCSPVPSSTPRPRAGPSVVIDRIVQGVEAVINEAGIDPAAKSAAMGLGIPGQIEIGHHESQVSHRTSTGTIVGREAAASFELGAGRSWSRTDVADGHLW